MRFGEHEDDVTGADEWFDTPPRFAGLGSEDPEPAAEASPGSRFPSPASPVTSAGPAGAAIAGPWQAQSGYAQSRAAGFGGSWFDPTSRPERDRPSRDKADLAADWTASESALGWSTPEAAPSWAAAKEPAPGWAASEPDASWAAAKEPAPGWSTPDTAPGWGALSQSGSSLSAVSPEVEDTVVGPWSTAGFDTDPAPARGDTLFPFSDGSPRSSDTPPRGSDDFSREDGEDFARDDALPRRNSDDFARGERGEGASSSWADVTRGGTPAGINASSRPGSRAGLGAPPWPTMPGGIDLAAGMNGNGDASNGTGTASPFAGARPAGFSAPGAARAAQTGTSRAFRQADTGNFRRHGQDSGAFRRIRDTGAMRAIMDTGAMRSLMDTAAFQALRDRYAGKGRVIAAIVIAGWVVLAAVGMFLAFGLHNGGSSATASSRPTTTATAGGHPTTPPATHPTTGKGSTATAAGPAHALAVVKVVAWGPTGTGSAEHPEQAARAIDASATTAWHSQWYKSASFPGVGLLFDMGKTVTVTSIKLKLAPGNASFILRVGNKAKPGTLTKVAARSNSGGDVTIKLTKPARGRYVEFWVTLLPKDSAGTYQELVYSVQVTGRA